MNSGQIHFPYILDCYVPYLKGTACINFRLWTKRMQRPNFRSVCIFKHAYDGGSERPHLASLLTNFFSRGAEKCHHKRLLVFPQVTKLMHSTFYSYPGNLWLSDLSPLGIRSRKKAMKRHWLHARAHTHTRTRTHTNTKTKRPRTSTIMYDYFLFFCQTFVCKFFKNVYPYSRNIEKSPPPN